MRTIFGFFGGLLLAGIFLETLFQVLPVNSGLRLEATSQDVVFSRYLSRLPYTYSFGWAMGNARRGIANAQGFNNSPDFADQADALIIGDSYIESLMLEYPKTVQGRLSQLTGRAVYAASASGNGLADSLEIVRYYAPRIHPRNVIMFVEEYDIGGLLDQPSPGHSAFRIDGLNVLLQNAPYRESASKQLMAKSALIRYVYYNLKVRDRIMAAPSPSAHASPTSVNSETTVRKERILNYYFDQLLAMSKANGIHFIFLVDGDRNAIYSPNRNGAVRKGFGLPGFVLAARARGFDVVDMNPEFQRHWNTVHERMDFLPMDGHWNSVAHDLAARRIVPLLQ